MVIKIKILLMITLVLTVMIKNSNNERKVIRRLVGNWKKIIILSFLPSQPSLILILNYVNNKSFKI